MPGGLQHRGHYYSVLTDISPAITSTRDKLLEMISREFVTSQLIAEETKDVTRLAASYRCTDSSGASTFLGIAETVHRIRTALDVCFSSSEMSVDTDQETASLYPSVDFGRGYILTVGPSTILEQLEGAHVREWVLVQSFVPGAVEYMKPDFLSTTIFHGSYISFYLVLWILNRPEPSGEMRPVPGANVKIIKMCPCQLCIMAQSLETIAKLNERRAAFIPTHCNTSRRLLGRQEPVTFEFELMYTRSQAIATAPKEKTSRFSLAGLWGRRS